MVLTDLYETEYQIYNHINPTIRRPLASVAMHEAEEINEGSLLQNAIGNYIRAGIGEHTRLSLVEFLELPRDIVEMIVSICDKQSRQKESSIKDIEAQFRTPK